MKLKWLLFLGAIGLSVCAAAQSTPKPYKPVTVRGQAQYLSIDESEVEDTCPGADIFNQFTCTKDTPAGFSCFDVYRVEGEPIDKERYTLLDETITEEPNTADPLCNFEGPLTCENFLASLKYNLDFSWFIANFPSSSFPQCGKTYTCTRIACWQKQPPTESGNVQSKKLMCVFKRNLSYFLGAQITCQDKNAPSK